MSISFACSTCNKKINAPDTAAGKRGRCPSCQAVIEVPSAPPGPAAAKPTSPTRDAAAAKASPPVSRPPAKQPRADRPPTQQPAGPRNAAGAAPPAGRAQSAGPAPSAAKQRAGELQQPPGSARQAPRPQVQSKPGPAPGSALPPQAGTAPRGSRPATKSPGDGLNTSPPVDNSAADALALFSSGPASAPIDDFESLLGGPPTDLSADLLGADFAARPADDRLLDPFADGPSPRSSARDAAEPSHRVAKTELRPTSERSSAERSSEKRPSRGPRSRHLHWLLLLTLAPLAASIFIGANDTKDRFLRTLEAHPDLLAQISQQRFSRTELLSALPGHAIEGALLPADTIAHWVFALISAGLFVGLIKGLFDLGGATLVQILLMGLFTSTVGVLSLLAFQFAADWSQGYIVTGRSVLVLLFWVVRFIGFSYQAALDPENGFILSLLGFTFGVGLCEEITKALPLMLRVGDLQDVGWRGALVWGLASGAGFGIAEGILYASDHYNGVATGGVYLVRFVSCVALHAVWTAISALILFRNQDVFDGLEGWLDMILACLRIVAVPMVLHGLYDTLLKRDMDALALGVAVVSFLPLAWLIEQVYHASPPDARKKRRSAAAQYA